MNKYINSLRIRAIVAVSILVLAACSGTQHKTEIEKVNPVPVTAGIAETQINSDIHASGYIEAGETAVISTRVMGFINSIQVKPGDIVKKGQPLVTISNSDILPKQAQARALVAEAEAALKDAQKDYERFTQLHEQQSASAKELENAALHYASVKARAETARQLQNEAEAMLLYTNLTAPFAGVIVQKNMDAGSIAQPGTPILILEKTESYEVTASVPEVYIQHIQKGMPAHVIIKTTGETIAGKISEVSPSSRFSSGQYILKVSISAGSVVYSGMYAEVIIASSKKNIHPEGTVLVPTSALVSHDQLTSIYTISESNTALLRWVRTGKAVGDRTEVLAGLVPGERIILFSEERLYNGVPVSIQ